MRFFILWLLLLLPTSSYAAVIISEVAWMGSSASANHEWIELHNNGTAVDVSGWVLTDGMNLSIPLTGTVPANSYVVLERTSDNSAPGTAFLIYTGALVNTGATLQLKRGDGGLEDQVAGGENWQSIGGDNITKETAQYTTSGWVTGPATPGASNSGSAPSSPSAEEPSSTDGESVSNNSTPVKLRVGSGEAVRLILPDVSLVLKVEAQKLGYVNQSINFEARPTGIGDTLVDSLSYEWNFGDGTMAFAKNPTHSYRYPGTYVVTVYGGYKRQEQVARHEITILPVSVSLTTSRDGAVQLNNESPYEIDISGYSLDGGIKFVFPPRTVLLPNQTITIPAVKVGDAKRVVARDAAGITLLTKGIPKEPDTPTEPAIDIQATSATSTEFLEQEDIVWYPPLLPPATDTLREALEAYLKPPQAEAAVLLGTTTTPSSAVPKTAWPYIAFIIVIILGLFGTARKFGSNQNQ